MDWLKVLRVVAALLTIATFVFPVKWVRLTMLGTPVADYSFLEALSTIQSQGQQAKGMLATFIFFAVGFSLGAIATILGHPLKGSFFNIILLFCMADRRILKPFTGVDLWFTTGYDCVGGAAFFVLLIALLDRCCCTRKTPKAEKETKKQA